nr:hypothetical protein [Tanacetum cinerariifolium]
MYNNVSQEIRDQLNTKAEVVQIILIGKDNDIYSTVDACPNACEMWKAIKRLKQGESINVQDLETNLYWEFGSFTSQDGESLESYYSRGKAIVNSPQPIYDQEPSMVAEDDETSNDKEIDKLIDLISLSFKKIYKPTNNNLRTSSNTSRANQDNYPRINRSVGYEDQRIANVSEARETVGSTVVQKSMIQCYNCKEFGHVARECQKPKRAKDAAYHREKMLMSHYMYMAQLQEVCPDAADSGPIFDAEPLQKSQELKTVSYHKLYDILKQHQHEVNEIRAKKIARVANPLALVAQQQPVYHPQTHPTHYNQNSLTKSQQAATRNRGKAIVNSPQPIYDQEPSMVDDDDDEISKEKEIDKLMDLISLSFKKIYKPTNNNLRTSSNTSRAKDAAYHSEKMLLCKQEEAGIQLNAEQADWKDDTDDESDDQELEAHYMYMAKIQEVSPDALDSGPIFDTEPEQKVQNDDHYDVFAIECQHPEQSETVHKTYIIEQDAHNVIIESVDMNYDSEQIDQNDEDADHAKERELLASLIKKLKCEIDESKNHNKFLETSNKVLIDKLKSEIEDFKNKNKSLELSNNQFKEANNKLSQENDLLYADFKKSQAELKRRDSIEYASEMKLECAKIDQNDEDADLAKERELLASLIEKLKCEIDESKNRNKFLETSNKVLIDKLKSEIKDFKNKKNSLELSNNQFKEANNKLSEENDLLYADFKKSQAELKRRDSIEYASEMELECAK